MRVTHWMKMVVVAPSKFLSLATAKTSNILPVDTMEKLFKIKFYTFCHSNSCENVDRLQEKICKIWYYTTLP